MCFSTALLKVYSRLENVKFDREFILKHLLHSLVDDFEWVGPGMDVHKVKALTGLNSFVSCKTKTNTNLCRFFRALESSLVFSMFNKFFESILGI